MAQTLTEGKEDAKPNNAPVGRVMLVLLRFIDPDNNERIFDSEKERYWMPVDLYIGGADMQSFTCCTAASGIRSSLTWALYHTMNHIKDSSNQGMILAFAYENQAGAKVPVDQVEEEMENSTIKITVKNSADSGKNVEIVEECDKSR